LWLLAAAVVVLVLLVVVELVDIELQLVYL
jgi:hypothetical protein